MKLKQFIITTLIALVVCYNLFAFANAELAFFNWTDATRYFCATIMFAIILFNLVIKFHPDND